jgi:hypothetical protein
LMQSNLSMFLLLFHVPWGPYPEQPLPVQCPQVSPQFSLSSFRVLSHVSILSWFFYRVRERGHVLIFYM